MQTSAKSHIGHLEANAGQAGIIKCTLEVFYFSGLEILCGLSYDVFFFVVLMVFTYLGGAGA